MRIITQEQLDNDTSLYDDAVEIIRNDGLVCFPGHRQYSIAASLMSTDAVVALVQSKRRSGKAPSLILIPNESQLSSVAQDVAEVASALIQAFWPGPLTLVVHPNASLPSKVLKLIGEKKPARIGVRVPGHGFQQELVMRFGGPLLISSANLSQKVGAGSASNVRKNFNHTVDLMFDVGDIPEKAPSTIVDLTREPPTLIREGKIPASQVMDVLQSATHGGETKSEDD
ncbi:MAG TPA: L-threonylcarbamoyladenylate synthase [Polyangiaceae bacterium]|jgi:L-threonylcarbamoyladenylate synthase|nr:L-threonylcarbamoyladenylate synthase [Polyangiaceae bacterium]HNZ21444.1 L-threonylcarbamoyladenylate synthase [Polyangiaceae bacterium]HOD23761.1 L-threonylcarbamoyladenylate synthase [Polyangiaceae bacterium]HOE51184.1 L-threonylcarbamoyladenylate synthase [Polyangiaceae bacterium]HOH02814.1 L-threonylcarbamoyladenylate synthase [Polyangiaceae bacterium]